MPADLRDITVGKTGFIERHGLWTDEQKEAVPRIKAEIETRGLEVVRRIASLKTISWRDRHYPAAEFWKRYDAGEFGK